jgi:hypothetical protein
MSKYDYLIKPVYLPVSEGLYVTHVIHEDFLFFDKIVALLSHEDESNVYYPYEIDPNGKKAIAVSIEESNQIELLLLMVNIDYSHLPPELW